MGDFSEYREDRQHVETKHEFDGIEEQLTQEREKENMGWADLDAAVMAVAELDTAEAEAGAPFLKRFVKRLHSNKHLYRGRQGALLAAFKSRSSLHEEFQSPHSFFKTVLGLGRSAGDEGPFSGLYTRGRCLSEANDTLELWAE